MDPPLPRRAELTSSNDANVALAWIIHVPRREGATSAADSGPLALFGKRLKMAVQQGPNERGPGAYLWYVRTPSD